jgi:hypothetical protein
MAEKKRAWGTSEGLSIKPDGFFARRLAEGTHLQALKKEHPVSPASPKPAVPSRPPKDRP